jgi:chemosensory pili system protein ChpA (sensor histidine kinase/response regulator)
MAEPIAQPLVWVSQELATTLSEARIALEDFAERPEHSARLADCAELIHQAQGALRIVEVYGASLLAEEMEQLARYLVENVSKAHQQDEGLDALSRGIVQLPAYMDRVLSGGRDIPLVLLPILNDLRAARGKPLLSENTLLLLNLPSDRQLLARGARPQASGEDIVELARRLRPRYQAALLSWIRGERPDSSLAVIADVAGSLERAAAEVPVFQVWWVLGAVVEALRQGGLTVSAAVKRLLGQVDRQIRRLMDEGEAGFAAAPPLELLNSLLFYVARATTRGSRVSAIRNAFSLADLLPGEGELEEAREGLSGPSVKLMRTVADAIREDLAKIKDVLDVYARTGSAPQEGLDTQLELLKKIGDTLGVLGLGELRAVVQAEADRLKTALETEGPADEEELLAIAGSMLRVEDHLEQQLLGLVTGEPARPESGEGEEGDEELNRVTSAVLRECLVNMARVRDAISERLAGPVEPQVVDGVPEQLKAVTSALLVLERPRAVALLERVTAVVRQVLSPEAGEFPRGALDRLADAIVSLEYFMETVQAGRRDPVFMLENAEACLEAMEVLGGRVPEYRPVLGDLSDTVDLVPEEAADQAAIRAAPLAVYAGEERPDPELLELFIEEAKELAGTIGTHFPAWRDDAQNVEDLTTVRRAFHTLKGSGRMVGARLIGEYAWAVENLMNNLLEGRVERSDALVRFLDRAVAEVGGLIEQLESGRRAKIDPGAFMEQARAFAEGRPGAAEQLEATLAAQPAEPEEAVAEEATAEMDPVLRDIFTREATGHLEVLRHYTEGCRLRTPPYTVTEAAHRASHTLAGSANMAGVAPAVAVARPLNEYLRRLHDDRAGLPEDGLKLVEAATEAVSDVVAALRDGRAPPPAAEDIAEAIRALHEEYQIRAEAGAEEAEAEPELDHEIAALFCEEAGEILEEAQGALAHWRDAPADANPLRALQRHLHTLKGGARLAGISVMGDFSHQLESLFERLAQGRQAVAGGTRELAQECVDALATMLDTVNSGHLPAARGDLAARLDAALAGEAQPEEEIPEAGPPEEAAEEAVTEEAGPTEPVAEEAPETEGIPEVPAAEEEKVPGFPAPPIIEFGQPPPLPPQAPSVEPAVPARGREAPAVSAVAPQRQELARVDADLLEQLLNYSGEVGIFRSRLEEQVGSIEFNLQELAGTVIRLRDQLRKMEMETEAQILHRHQGEIDARGDFDPLELDRYSTIQQLSRALAETASDVASIQDLLGERTREAESLLVQQSRAVSELQDGLMRTRMVPFNRHAQRLSRLVRQAASEHGRRAELQVEGGTAELDRQVMERLLAPLEHLLRNAVIHGIESPGRRREKGKPEAGRVSVSVRREGAEIVVEVSDDGAGLDLGAIRRQAEARSLVLPGVSLSDTEAAQLILQPGFSTARELTQSAGRGVGMDVVASEIRRLGGALQIHNRPGAGARFEIRLPFTRAITQALVVRAGEEWFALPLPAVEGVVRVPAAELSRYLGADAEPYRYGEEEYRFEHIGALVEGYAGALPETGAVPAILVRAGEHPTALLTDEMLGAREIVVKVLGPQLAGIHGIAGATILGDGRIVLILDVAALIRARASLPELPEAPRPIEPKEDDRTFVMVVDDSITVRRVTERLLERNGMRVVTARDGVEAVTLLQEQVPDVMLLDIEMPRMDGYEVASHVRNDPRLRHIPIVMITSRVGDKHRNRALEIGVDHYLGKPYQETDLLAAIESLAGRRRGGRGDD